MRLTARSTIPKPLSFVIEHDEYTGYSLYVYDGETCIRDYLQDTLTDAKEMANEDFNVPLNAWKTIES